MLQNLHTSRSTAADTVKLLAQFFLIAPRLGQSNIGLGAGTEHILRKLLGRGALRLDERGQSHTHNLAERTHIILGHPLPQTHLLLVQKWLVVESATDSFYALGVGALVVQTPDDTCIYIARAELHSHSITHAHGVALGTLGYRETVGGLRQRQHYVGKTAHNFSKIQIYFSEKWLGVLFFADVSLHLQ